MGSFSTNQSVVSAKTQIHIEKMWARLGLGRAAFTGIGAHRAIVVPSIGVSSGSSLPLCGGATALLIPILGGLHGTQTRTLRDYPIQPLVRNQHFLNKRRSYKVKKEWNLGIVLEPSEVKSLRARNANLSAAFAAFYNHELFLHQLHIPVWRHGVIGRPEPQRVRKLLATRSELKQLEAFSHEKHAHLIPTRVEVGKTGWIKVRLAQCYKHIEIDNRRRDDEREAKRRLKENF